jgi:hypothetical protein
MTTLYEIVKQYSDIILPSIKLLNATYPSEVLEKILAAHREFLNQILSIEEQILDIKAQYIESRNSELETKELLSKEKEFVSEQRKAIYANQKVISDLNRKLSDLEQDKNHQIHCLTKEVTNLKENPDIIK